MRKNESQNLLLQAPILPSETKRNVKNECQRRGNKKEKPYFIILWSTGQIFLGRIFVNFLVQMLIRQDVKDLAIASRRVVAEAWIIA